MDRGSHPLHPSLNKSYVLLLLFFVCLFVCLFFLDVQDHRTAKNQQRELISARKTSHCNCCKGNIWETSERRCGALMGFS